MSISNKQGPNLYQIDHEVTEATYMYIQLCKKGA